MVTLTPTKYHHHKSYGTWDIAFTRFVTPTPPTTPTETPDIWLIAISPFCFSSQGDKKQLRSAKENTLNCDEEQYWSKSFSRWAAGKSPGRKSTGNSNLLSSTAMKTLTHAACWSSSLISVLTKSSSVHVLITFTVSLHFQLTSGRDNFHFPRLPNFSSLDTNELAQNKSRIYITKIEKPLFI